LSQPANPLTLQTVAAAAQRSVRSRARALIVLALAFLLAATVVGLGWDRRWHTAYAFVSFFSPPHLFIYGTIALTLATVAAVALSPDLRAELGTGFEVPLVTFPLPGPLALALAGLGVVLLAGGLDAFWHSTFGLDETSWSMPHAMLASGFALSFLGILSCYLRLFDGKALPTPVALALGTLLVLFTIRLGLGPLDLPTQELVRRTSWLPIFAIQPSAQHSFRIYLAWHLNRAHPAFAPLAAVAAGLALSLLWGLARRPRTFLGAVVLVTVLIAIEPWGEARFFGLARDIRNWLPVPILPAAIGFVLARGRGDAMAWITAGLVFAFFTVVTWNPSAPLFLLSGAGFAAGAAAGAQLWRTVVSPDRTRVALALGIVGLALPAVTGTVDIYLRTHTV
jgi:hypothetical protein